MTGIGCPPPLSTTYSAGAGDRWISVRGRPPFVPTSPGSHPGFRSLAGRPLALRPPQRQNALRADLGPRRRLVRLVRQRLCRRWARGYPDPGLEHEAPWGDPIYPPCSRGCQARISWPAGRSAQAVFQADLPLHPDPHPIGNGAGSGSTLALLWGGPPDLSGAFGGHLESARLR